MAMIDSGDPHFDLLSAVLVLTVRDAKKGDREAIEWLWVCAPDIAERLGLPILPGPEPEPECVAIVESEAVRDGVKDDQESAREAELAH